MKISTAVFACTIVSLTTRISRAADVLEEIGAAWTERQEQIQTFDVEWEQSLTMAANSVRIGPNDELFPPEDLTYVNTYRVVGKNGMLFHSHNGPDWQPHAGSFRDLDFQKAFDGHETRDLWQSEEYGEHPSGYIAGGTRIDAAGNYHIQGATLCFRPLISDFSGIGSLGEWSPTNRAGSIEGVDCLILERARGPGVERLWLAEDGDYRVLRHEMVARDLVFSQLTIEYEEREDVGNVISSFKHLLLNPRSGKPRHSFTSEVRRLAINEPVEDEQFRIEFPPGTIVNEGGERSIVTKAAELRPVAPGEIEAGATWEDLMRSDPPRELQSGSSWTAWLIGVLAGVAALSILVFWRKSNRRIGSN